MPSVARSRLLAGTFLLVALVIGLLINETVVWALIAMPMTAIVLALLAEHERSRAQRQPARAARPTRRTAGLSR